MNTIFKTCTKCEKRKAIDCCFGDITLSWCKQCRSRQQNEREISKRPKFENYRLTIERLESRLQEKDTAIERLKKERDALENSSQKYIDYSERLDQDQLIRELLKVVEFYRWTHPSELFEIDEYTVSTNPMVTSSGKKALSILNSEGVKKFKEKAKK